ncbi:hypothetical protein, partial [Acinetobacter indicus]|uniref:hypothetical protein n=1 Tax=Acinetobacter indicus TaxID=756892 RepID=UPI001BB15C67
PFFAVPMKRQKRCVQLRLHYGNSVALAPSSSLSKILISWFGLDIPFLVMNPVINSSMTSGVG